MIEVRGVIESRDSGHSYVQVVVTVGTSSRQFNHLVGIDIKPSRGKIITFLGTIYNEPPGKIVWPAHIELETGV